jgi:hypothetical protein
MEVKMALFGHLPDKCMVCQDSFDKSDRKMVMSWSVVVREQEGKVNLYCPTCWKKGTDLVKEMKEGLEKNA